MKNSVAIVWFRKDLRLFDQPALFEALQNHGKVLCIYIHDSERNRWKPGRGSSFWLHHSLKALESALKKRGAKLYFFKGRTEKVLQKLLVKTKPCAIYANVVYEPGALLLDEKIKKKLPLHLFHGNLLHAPDEIFNKQGSFYRVFTPFWKHCLESKISPPLSAPKKIPSLKWNLSSFSLEQLSLLKNDPFEKKLQNFWKIGEEAAQKKWKIFLRKKIDAYEKNRDYPHLDATSQLSASLHFGEISPRQIYFDLQKKKSSRGTLCFLKEITWREFSQYALFHSPQIDHLPYQKKFLHFAWKKSPSLLLLWQKGKTGFPIVDAAMRQLLETGWMHNRLRMIVASFLTKNLLQNWVFGARWFWEYLVDADLGNNSMGWQWIAGTGIDAAPFFRIFNPITQAKKFDPEGSFVKKYLPELACLPKEFLHEPWLAPKEVLKKAKLTLLKDYPLPICDLAETRNQALKAYSRL